jgi:hypothetical protein
MAEPAAETPVPETPDGEGAAAAAIEAALEALATRDNVPVEEIEVVSSERMEWTDSCLGLGGPAESCLQAITPGWLVILQVAGEDAVVEARTDESGDVVRFQETNDETTDLPAAAERAREQLAADRGISIDTIEAVSATQAEWTDSCLGLGGPAESCLQVITPGWLVMLQVAGEDVVVEARTDETGDVVRFQEMTDPTSELPAAAVRAREQLAAEQGIDVGSVEVISFTQEEWTDSCLGMGGPAEMCLQVITPGWRVILEADGQTYKAHTDRTGDIVRVAAGGSGQDRPLGDSITFERTGGIAGEDVTYRIFADGTIERLTGAAGADQPIEAIPVDPAAVEELFGELEAAGFFELPMAPSAEVPCCDFFVYSLSATRGNRLASITVVEQDENAADEAVRSVELVQAFVDEAWDSVER